MHIAINCRSFINPHYTGIGRYAFNLVDSLAKIDFKNKYTLYTPKGLFNRTKIIPQFHNPNFRAKVDWLKRGPERCLSNIDIYHSPCPDFVEQMKGKIVVTVHDLVYKAYPDGHTDETLRLTDEQFQSFLPRADRIICCSDNTRQDLHKYFDVDVKKTALIYQGVDRDVFFPLEDAARITAEKQLKQIGVEAPFLLFVGTIEPRKNLKGLCEAMALLKQKGKFGGTLVVVGMKGWKSEDIGPFIQGLKLENHIVFPGYVNNDQLRYLYNLCEVFVFPSFYEGFGYPVVEALSCGAAVVASKTSSVPEIYKDAALGVSPWSSEDIAGAIEKILDQPELKLELRAKALKRAEQFSFEKTARETLAVYEELAAGH